MPRTRDSQTERVTFESLTKAQARLQYLDSEIRRLSAKLESRASAVRRKSSLTTLRTAFFASKDNINTQLDNLKSEQSRCLSWIDAEKVNQENARKAEELNSEGYQRMVVMLDEIKSPEIKAQSQDANLVILKKIQTDQVLANLKTLTKFDNNIPQYVIIGVEDMMAKTMKGYTEDIVKILLSKEFQRTLKAFFSRVEDFKKKYSGAHENDPHKKTVLTMLQDAMDDRKWLDLLVLSGFTKGDDFLARAEKDFVIGYENGRFILPENIMKYIALASEALYGPPSMLHKERQERQAGLDQLVRDLQTLVKIEEMMNEATPGLISKKILPAEEASYDKNALQKAVDKLRNRADKIGVRLGDTSSSQPPKPPI